MQLATISEHLGHQTNNYAEYTGLLRGLQAALACGVRRIAIRGDSKLVVMQVPFGNPMQFTVLSSAQPIV